MKRTFILILLLGLIFKIDANAKSKPTVYTIGDSTVKNGRGDGAGGLWGWGDAIVQFFDTTKISVENHALGGTSSRTFQTKGLWDEVRNKLKPGDFVLMQFGHNDNGPLNDTLRTRGTIKGTGNESEEIDNLMTNQREVVHSYGWYLRKMVRETKEKGATPVIITPIPRNDWENGKIKRTPESYPEWAMQVARQEKIQFIDLNKLMSDKLDLAGEANVTGRFYFSRDHTHTSAEGAVLSASIVVGGLKAMPKFKLTQFLLKDPKVIFPVKKRVFIIGGSTTARNFDFGSGVVKEGYEQVTEKSVYTAAKGFGLIPSGEIVSGKTASKDPLTSDYLGSKKPFYFVADLPEGHYRVTLTLGGAQEGSSIAIKAESRRLMAENIITTKGKTVQKIIIVDVRTPKINDSEQIKLKDRELNYLNWDNKLTLEFTGEHPCVAAIEIKSADEQPTIFLAGNSTVTDQENEPWASWGQMFPCFLKPGIVVANYAESGETLLAFKREKRLQKLLSQMKAGDYMLMEFAHNDQKPGGNHLDAYTTYKDELKFFIAEARKKGGKPVLVTSTNRRRFDDQGKIVNTLEDYPEAMRQTAREENVPLIDLNAMSKQFYEALGPENSKKAFVHYPANTYPGQDKPLADDTHFNPYGAYELAKCVVHGIRQNKMDLVNYLIDGLPAFDPAHPDKLKAFRWYESPSSNLLKPDGN